MGQAGSACRISQIFTRVQSERNKSSSNCLKWDTDAAASTLGFRAQGETRALGWLIGEGAGSWELGGKEKAMAL